MNVRTFREEDRQRVIGLWKACGLVVPQNDPDADIDAKVAFQPDLFLVAESGREIVASVMAGYDGHRGWINYLAVAPRRQRQGLGRRVMTEAQTRLKALGCQKINLQVRTTNQKVIAFYEAIGYALDDVVSLGRRLRQVGPS